MYFQSVFTVSTQKISNTSIGVCVLFHLKAKIKVTIYINGPLFTSTYRPPFCFRLSLQVIVDPWGRSMFQNNNLYSEKYFVTSRNMSSPFVQLHVFFSYEKKIVSKFSSWITIAPQSNTLYCIKNQINFYLKN